MAKFKNLGQAIQLFLFSKFVKFIINIPSNR